MENEGNIPDPTRWKALTGLHVAVFLFGLSGLFGKSLALTPLVIVFGRTFFGALSLFIVLRAKRSSLRFSSNRDALGMVFLGALLAFHWFSFFHSIQLSTVAIGLLTYSSFPVFTTLLEPWLLSRPRRKNEIVLAAVVVTGLVLVVPGYEPGNRLFQGAVWGVVSGASFALLQIANKIYVRKYPGLGIAFYQNFWACLCLLPLSGIWKAGLNVPDIGFLLLLGVGCTGFAHALYINSMRVVTAQFASLIAALEPVYGIAFALIIFGESPGFRTLAGGAIIIGATIIASRLQQARTPVSS